MSEVDNEGARMPPPLPNIVRFGPHIVTSQVFYRTALSFALVNIRPLLPGHVLICPHRSVQSLQQMRQDEIADLFGTVQRVQRTLRRLYDATAFNVTVQDGAAAGQTVPHVHCHLIPRRQGDMDARGGGDVLYDLLAKDEGDVGAALRTAEASRQPEERQSFRIDVERKDRTAEETTAEAEWLAREMEADERQGQ